MPIVPSTVKSIMLSTAHKTKMYILSQHAKNSTSREKLSVSAMFSHHWKLLLWYHLLLNLLVTTREHNALIIGIFLKRQHSIPVQSYCIWVINLTYQLTIMQLSQKPCFVSSCLMHIETRIMKWSMFSSPHKKNGVDFTQWVKNLTCLHT